MNEFRRSPDSSGGRSNLPLSRVELREALPTDIEAVTGLDRAAFGAEAYPRAFFRQAVDLWPSLVLVAVEAGEIAAYALAAPAEGGATAWILSTVVRPSSRGRGVGALLMRDLVDRLRAAGYREVRLTVAPGNIGGLRLYEKLGFRSVVDEAEYFGPGAPRRVMRLPLRG